MAGVKRKLAPGGGHQGSTAGRGGRQASNGGRSRGRGNGRGRGTATDAKVSASPSQPSKRTKKTKGESATAEQPDDSTPHRSTRQSARILSKEQGRDLSPVMTEGGELMHRTPLKAGDKQTGETKSAFGNNSSKRKTKSRSASADCSPNESDGGEGDCPSPTKAEKSDTDAGEDGARKKRKLNSDNDDDDDDEDTENDDSDGSSVDDDEDAKRAEPDDDGQEAADGAPDLPPESPIGDEFSTPTPSETREPSPSVAAVDTSRTPSRRGRVRRRGFGGSRGARAAARAIRGSRARARGRRVINSPRNANSKWCPPCSLAKRVRNRQKVIERAYRKVAAAQRGALVDLATRTHTNLVRNPKAHMATPLYQEVVDALGERLEENKSMTEKKYDFDIQEASRKFENDEELLEMQSRLHMEKIREEHIKAVQGAVMSLVEKYRQAEDEDHTETDESGSETGETTRKFVRGFNSSSIGAPEIAALYDRSGCEWEDFLQRAKIMDDISPQIQEIDQEARKDDAKPQESKQMGELIDTLLRASKEAVTPQPSQQQQPRLTALADVALKGDGDRQPYSARILPPMPQTQVPVASVNAPDVTQQQPRFPESLPPASTQLMQAPTMSERDHSRQLLPNYPPSFSTLPPPPGTGASPSTDTHGGMPRPLLPAPSQSTIPSLMEHRKLPDPFSSRAPPHLPAPPGMAYSQTHPPPPQLAPSFHAPPPPPTPASYQHNPPLAPYPPPQQALPHPNYPANHPYNLYGMDLGPPPPWYAPPPMLYPMSQPPHPSQQSQQSQQPQQSQYPHQRSQSHHMPRY